MSPTTPALVKVKPDPSGRFPHFIQHDADIWRRFLMSTDLNKAYIAYDIHVGTPAFIPEGTPPNYARMIRTLSTKRIDAVLFFPTETLICEVKPRAGTQAVGQALCNTVLFRRKYPDNPAMQPCIITDTAQPDLLQLCSHFDIVLSEVDHLEQL